MGSWHSSLEVVYTSRSATPSLTTSISQLLCRAPWPSGQFRTDAAVLVAWSIEDAGVTGPWRLAPFFMPENTFDLVSNIELPEVSNAVQQAIKEIQQRYDLKNSHSSIELREKENKVL